MDKLVSIILPTYNGSERIEMAIQSVLVQKYSNWELLVVDDGSQDNTALIVDNFVKKDSRIRYIKNEVNLGIQKTLNKGLAEVKGEYIARIDDDDIWIDKEKLRKQVEFLEKNKDHVLLGTGFIAIDEKDKEIFRRLNPESDEEIRENILNKTSFLHSSVMFRKESTPKFGGYSEDLQVFHIEDYDLWLKLGTIGKFANLPIYGVRFTLRNESISSKNKILQFRRSLQLIKKFKDQYPNYFKAFVCISIRLLAYRILTMKYLRPFFYKLYKLYKNS